ncbi:MAG: hypothetical protein ACJAZO_000639 [Myxococcota bacterium]|jgi:hypothetical protein
MAASYAARVSIDGGAPGTVSIDGNEVGTLPLRDASVRVGKRLVLVTFDDGPTAVWTLTVAPDEEIAMRFPSEDDDRSNPASGFRGTSVQVEAGDDPSGVTTGVTAGNTP